MPRAQRRPSGRPVDAFRNRSRRPTASARESGRRCRIGGGLLVGLTAFAATTGLVHVLSLFLQEGLHASPRGAALALLSLTLGIIGSAFAAMGGLVARLSRTLILIGLAIVLVGCGWVLCYSTIFDVALGDIDPDEAGSASGSLSSIQQLASGIGSAAVTSIFFQAADSGLDHAMKISLIVILVLVALSIPLITLMPRKAPEQAHH